MINCESDLGTHPGPITTDLRTLAITFPNGGTEKENSFLRINDGKHEIYETCLLLRTEEVQEKLCSRMQDKMDLQKNVGLSDLNTSDEKISDKTKVTTMGVSKTCAEKDNFRTEIIQGKLCSVILDKIDIQKNVGLSESNTNDEKISDETKVTTTGESKTCTEKDSFRTEIIQGKLCSVILDKIDIQKNVGLSESNTNDEKISDETKVTTTGESKTCTEKDSFRTEIIQGKLVSRIQDNMDIQKSVGLSESGASDEKNSDKTGFTAMGGSETCLEAGILRTEEAEGKLCSRTQDKMDLPESSGLGESDTSGEKICDVTNVTTTGDNETCLEMNGNKCKKIESNGKEGLKDAAQSVGVLGNKLEKQISDCDPVPDGGSAAEVYCMPLAGADRTCGTKVNLTSTANWCQKSTANLNGSLQSGKTSEVNRSANNHSLAASSLVVIKSKTDFAVSRSSSGTASNKTFRPVAKLLHDIGLDLVTEWVCQDLINVQTQTTTKSLLPEAEKTQQLSVLAANKQRLTKKNKAYAFHKRKCTCGFRSESRIVLAFHSQFGDASRNGDRYCCLCSFIAQQPRYFVRHMKRRHKLKALVTAKGAQYQCHFCPYENNHQLRIEGHLAKCCKLFDLNVNLCPVRMDSDIPVFLAPKPLLIGDVQAKQSTITSAAAPANHVFAAGGKPSRMPLHSSIPSCSLIIQQPQQCATIPSSVTFSLPLTRFIVTPSVSPVMPRIQFSVMPPKSQNSAQPCCVVSSVVSPSLLPVVASSPQLALPAATRSSLQTNMIISPSHRGFVLPTNFAQNLSQTIPPRVGKDAPQSLLGVPSAVTLVRPEPCLLVPPSLSSDLLRMQLLASPQASIVQFQNPRNTSGPETRFIQMGNQMCTIVQHQGRSVLTPLIFPRPILPLTPSFNLSSPLSSSQPTVSSGRKDVIQNSGQLSSSMLSSSISLQRDTVSFVRMPNLQPPTNTNRLSFGLEICELCDGFVKDRQSLSVHFRNAHKVSFMTEDLNCVVPSQTCSLCWQSFFTISGLLRHYHLVHASDSRLVKPLERCSLCKNINLKNAVEHLSSHHHDVMSKLHDFKQCGICPLHLRDVKSFEKHMLLVHDNLFANRNILLATIAASLSDKTWWVGDSNPPGLNGQPKECSKKPGKACHTCRSCGTTHSTAEELNNHIISNHMHKCSRCREAFNSLPSLRRHFHMKHSTEREVCPLCLKTVQIGRPFIRHMKSQHLKDCCVRIEHMHNSDACGNQAKRRTINSDNLVNCSAQKTSIPVDGGSLKYDDDLSSHSAKKLKLESDQSLQK